MNKSHRTVIVQSNRLIEARYQLSLSEQRLIFAMISMIEPDDEDFKSYRIKLAELAELWDISQDVVYREAKVITSRLMKRLLQITEPDGTLIQVHWVCLAIHKPGYITLQFHPLLKPYLLQLKGAFTKCNLHLLNQFQSIYTIRIYQLLKQYKDIGRRSFLIDDLKETLGIDQDKYKIFKDFRRRVLDKSKNELDMKGDLTFTLDGIEKGKKTKTITFKIISKSKSLLPDKESTNPKKIASHLRNFPKQRRFPEYWDEFLQYLEKNDPGLLPIIESDGAECGIVKVPYLRWLRETKGEY